MRELAAGPWKMNQDKPYRRHTPIPFNDEQVIRIRQMISVLGYPVECPGCGAELRTGRRADQGFAELFCPDCHRNLIFRTSPN